MKRILIFMLWLSPMQLLAQTMWFEGGKGDGYSLEAYTNFSPQLLSSSHPYVGGKGDGHSLEAYAIFNPQLVSSSHPYVGGTADGFGSDQALNFIPALVANFTPYVGGIKDGHSTDKVTNFVPSLVDNFHPYQGGLADGGAVDGTTNFQADLVTNFYPYVGGVGDGWSNSLNQSYVLPLVLLSFEGQAMGDYNALKWKTSIEENVDYFLVEKSKDGIDFASIGNVNAVGNSSTEQSYDFDDRNDVQGVNYYKLKMTDIDNLYKYSKVIKLINEKLDYSVILAPNPAKDNISIRLSRALETSSQFTVLDMTGKVVLKKTIGKDEAIKNIDIQSLVPGQYMIYLNLANDTMSLPFIKK